MHMGTKWPEKIMVVKTINSHDPTLLQDIMKLGPFVIVLIEEPRAGKLHIVCLKSHKIREVKVATNQVLVLKHCHISAPRDSKENPHWHRKLLPPYT